MHNLQGPDCQRGGSRSRTMGGPESLGHRARVKLELLNASIRVNFTSFQEELGSACGLPSFTIMIERGSLKDGFRATCMI